MGKRSAKSTCHNWLARVRSNEPAPRLQDWVSVASVKIDDPESGFSDEARRAVKLLAEAGVEAQQHPYVLPDNTGFLALPGAIPSPVDRIRIAILVHSSDAGRAREIMRGSGQSAGGLNKLDHD